MGWIDNIVVGLLEMYRTNDPNELCNLLGISIEKVNIDIEERIIKGGIKTDAGKNRIIPINQKILLLIKNRISEKNEFLM